MPSPPTGLAATVVDRATVQLSWTNAVDATLLFTRVYVSTVNTFAETNFSAGVRSNSGSGQSANVPNLTAGTTYYFWLKAEDNSGTPTLSTLVGSVSVVPAASYSVTPVYDFVALDVLKHLVANITGFSNGAGGTVALYTGPLVLNTGSAGYVSLTQDVPFTPSNRVNGANLSVLCVSATEATAFGAAESIRQYFHPKEDRVGFELPSGRFVLAARNAIKQELGVKDGSTTPRFQVQVNFLLQLQDDFN